MDGRPDRLPALQALLPDAVWTSGDLVCSAVERGIAATAARVTTDKLWVAWPKKTSALAVDVSAGKVRAAGLAHGLVDFKVCAIDRDWSGLCFARRRWR